MAQELDRLIETPSQTAGPYVHIGCLPSFAGVEGVYPQDLAVTPFAQGAAGEIITITGSVYDGTGTPLCDAVLESWQADAQGLFAGQKGADEKVSGFCRFAADKDSGEFMLRTIKPAAVHGRNKQIFAPHIALWIVARGINIGLQTRIYFEDEDNRADPLLAQIEQDHRRATLLAKKVSTGTYRFDIRLQGEGETVFLDL